MLLALVLLASCRRERDLSQYTIEDPAAHLPSTVALGNAAQQAQLLGGFHQIEEGRWRWTAKEFAVSLKAPFAAGQAGAVLELNGSLPELILSKTGPVTLAARIGGQTLPGVTFTTAGDAKYSVAVPPALLAQSPVRVDFTLSKALPAGTIPGDGRELGLIVSEIGLKTPKQ